MTTTWDKLAKKGKQKSRRYLSEQVDGLRRNLADIVLGQSETRVDNIQPVQRAGADDTAARHSKTGREPIAASLVSLEKDHSRRVYNSLRQCDSKEPYFSKERAEKQAENQLNSARKDPATPVRKGRVKRRARHHHAAQQPDGVGWQTRDHWREPISLNRHKRSSYPPLVANNSNTAETPLSSWPSDDKRLLQVAASSSSSYDSTLKNEHHHTGIQPGSPNSNSLIQRQSGGGRMSQDSSLRMEPLTGTKPSCSIKAKKRDSSFPSSMNGERKGSYERTRSYSTGGRMTSKQTAKKQNDVSVRKPPKAPSWQSLLTPPPPASTPASPSSVDKKKHLHKTESIPASSNMIQVRSEENSTAGPRPPKPPSWQTLTIPSQTATKRQMGSPSSSNKEMSRLTQSNHTAEENAEDDSPSSEQDTAELEDSVSESSAQGESADQRRQRKINIKRTRSRFIDSKEVPKQQTVVRLSQAKPLEFHLRETEFNDLIYLRENEERCKRWLQSLEYHAGKKKVSEILEDGGGGQFINYEEFFRGRHNFIGSPLPTFGVIAGYIVTNQYAHSIVA